MKAGIIGLPQTGKTTVFNALTGAHGEVGAHGRAATRVGVVKVPDQRIDLLAALFSPKKIRHATIEFEDIAGIFAHLGPGAEDSAEAFATARTMDALVMVLRAFDDPTVPHVSGAVAPARDYVQVNDDLLLADLGVVETRLSHIQKDMKRATVHEREALEEEVALLDRCRKAIEEERGVGSLQLTASQEKMLRSYAFLTLKNMVHVLNIGENHLGKPIDAGGIERMDPAPIAVCGRLEMEIMGLDPADRADFMKDAGLDELSANKVIRRCHEALGMTTFFTYAHDEVGAWMIHRGDNAVTAAGKVHTDIAHGFVRAEVVRFDDLKTCGTMKEARAHGKVRLEGRDYIVQDGDVITFRFNPSG